MPTLYKQILRPFLFKLSPDNAHKLASFGLKWAGKFDGTKSLTGKFLSFSHPALSIEIAGINFPNPIGLPGGFDPNADQATIYDALGFGFATMGSVTHQPQSGNPRPHFTRLNKDQSLIINKGLMNKGAKHVADTVRNLREKKKIDYPLGISIARTTDIPKEQTTDDYVKSFRLLAPQADYIEVNVSCPNVTIFSPEEQVEYIDEILTKINQIRHPNKEHQIPVWLKVGPDISDSWNEKIISLCLKQKVDAVVLTNLIKDRSRLKIKSSGWQDKPGGISGKLLAPFAEKKLAFFYKHLQNQIPIISVGGIFTAEDAYQRIRSGASLAQMLTGWIYEGPMAPKNINKELVQLLKKDGFENIREAVGSNLK